MLPSEHVDPEENNKEEGLSGCLESQCRVVGLSQICLVAKLGLNSQEAENGTGTKLGSNPAPM